MDNEKKDVIHVVEKEKLLKENVQFVQEKKLFVEIIN